MPKVKLTIEVNIELEDGPALRGDELRYAVVEAFEQLEQDLELQGANHEEGSFYTSKEWRVDPA